MSACEVCTHEIMRNDGAPVRNGVLDSRMGSDSSINCLTCGQSAIDCNGHFGHITMPARWPVYNMLFRGTTLKILNSICLECGSLLVPLEEAERVCVGLKGQARLQAVHKACSMARTCNVCEAPTATVSFVNFKLVRQAKDDEPAKSEQPARIYSLLDGLGASPETCSFLGFPTTSRGRPRDLLNTVIPVIPPCARPGIVIDDYRAEDDITVKYMDILKVRHALLDAEANGHPLHITEELYAQMQMHWSTLQRNDVGASVTKGGRPTRSLCDRNTGKSGRMRMNCQGKRVNNGGRTVITGDSNLRIDEVGVPLSIAQTLTVRVSVNRLNLSEMQSLMHQGKINYAHREGRVYDLEMKRHSGQVMNLIEGDIVERQLCNGDIVLFNRQPTLHRQGLMAMHVRVLPGSTLRMNLAITGGFNADFDGDEMNCVVPMGLEASIEAKTLMTPSNHIVSAASSKPIIAIIQDSLLISSIMSSDEMFLTKDQFFQICCQLDYCIQNIPPPARTSPDMWSGKQALSLALPRGLNADVVGCKIVDGDLIAGTYNKRVLGTSRGGLVHRVHMQFGNRPVSDFLGMQQKITNEFAMQNGTTVSLADMITTPAAATAIETVIRETRAKIFEIVSNLGETMDELPTKTESKVNSLLNSCRDRAGHIVQLSLDQKHNNLLKMVNSGSKGSLINIAQISGTVGQQNIDGSRISAQFDKRTLPHFKRGDFGDSARGFISNSYLKGLSPAEFFFHAKAGREGLLDTALRTSESGYLQRKCIKALEDIIVAYDATVRDSDGRILQFVYGEDNMDATRLDKRTMPTFEEHAFCWTTRELDEIGGDAVTVRSVLRVTATGRVRFFPAPTSAISVSQLDVLRTEETELRAACELCSGVQTAMLPIDTDVLLLEAVQSDVGKRHAHATDEEIAHPAQIAQMTSTLLSRLNRVPGKISHALEAYIRMKLSSKSLYACRLHPAVIARVMGRVESVCSAALVQPGEAVGLLAAQSLGEPLTQSTLNTFHFTGVSSMRATTQGLPRFREILGATENPTTPTITVPLLPGVDGRHVQRRLSHLKMGSLVACTFWGDDEETLCQNLGFETKTLMVKSLPPYAVVEGSSTRIRLELDPVALRKHAFTTDDGTAVDPVCYCAWKLETILGVHATALDSNYEKPCVILDAYPGSALNGSHALLERAALAVDIHGSEGVRDVVRLPGTDTLEMSGSNLQKVMGDSGVDGRNARSNHIRDVWRTLGVEAARETIVREIHATIEAGGSSIDLRHVFLVADLMCLSGDVVAVSRYGSNRSGRGPITRSSFEQTVEVLVDAAVSQTCDPLHGVSDKIFMGQRTRVGTGAIDCMLNLNAFEAFVKDEPTTMEQFDDDMFEAEELVGSRSYDPFAHPIGENFFGGQPLQPSWSPEHASIPEGFVPSSPTNKPSWADEDVEMADKITALPDGMVRSFDF